MPFKVSVLMLVYNHENSIEKSIESVLGQKTNFRVELIIGNDASTDKSAELIRKYKGTGQISISSVLRESNIGASKNLSDLIRRSDADYITFIEGDDYWITDNKLQLQVEYLEANRQVKTVGHQVKMIDQHGACLKISPPVSGEKRRFGRNDFLLGRRFPLMSCMICAPTPAESGQLAHLIESGPRNAADTTLCLFFLSRGPVDILSRPMSVYNYVTSDKGSNYNSITTFESKVRDKLRLIEVNEAYYRESYFIGLMHAWLTILIVKNIRQARACGYRKYTGLLIETGKRLCISVINYCFRFRR